MRYVVQLVVTGSQVLGRAFTRALREEIRTSQQAATRRRPSAAAAADSGSKADSRREAATSARLGMTVQEAEQILNLPESTSLDDLDNKMLRTHYDHLFSVNEKSKGGSFYLQSKVYRAKERIERELDEQRADFEQRRKPSDDADRKNSND